MDSFEARLQMMTLQIVPFFAAIVIHEFGHGWVAKLWGDRTASDEGRLTLNPIAHIDPIGTVLIPMMNMLTGIPLFFGWAKPVPINPTRFRKYRLGLFCVSLAGISANVILAFICALAVAAFHKFQPELWGYSEPLMKMLMIGVQINFAIALFNLLPIPPLDGAKVIESMVGYQGGQVLAYLERYSFIILLGLLWFNVLSFLHGPITALSNFSLGIALMVFGVR
jgi:Zn-dependent protease